MNMRGVLSNKIYPKKSCENKMKSKFTVLITNLKFLSNINLPKGSTTKATNLVVSFSDLRAS